MLLFCSTGGNLNHISNGSSLSDLAQPGVHWKGTLTNFFTDIGKKTIVCVDFQQHSQLAA